jgi:hypothetical protein
MWTTGRAKKYAWRSCNGKPVHSKQMLFNSAQCYAVSSLLEYEIELGMTRFDQQSDSASRREFIALQCQEMEVKVRNMLEMRRDINIRWHYSISFRLPRAHS